MSRPASQPATQGFRSLSLGEWLTLLLAAVGVIVVVAIGACSFGYDIGYREANIPNSPTPNSPTPILQWSVVPEGCPFRFTRVPIANWLGDAPEPTVCMLVP